MICPLIEDELINPKKVQQREAFDEKMKLKFGNTFELPECCKCKRSITPLFSDDKLSGEDDNISMDSIKVSDDSPV